MLLRWKLRSPNLFYKRVLTAKNRRIVPAITLDLINTEIMTGLRSVLLLLYLFELERAILLLSTYAVVIVFEKNKINKNK